MNRHRLASRRAAETFEIECSGLRYTTTVGRYDDGSLAEVFIQSNKSDSMADVNARDAAIACSLALQHGVELEIIRSALCRDQSGRASGPLGTALDAVK